MRSAIIQALHIYALSSAQKHIEAPRHDVTIVLPDLRLGGAQRTIANLLPGWLAEGRSICLITLSHRTSDLFAVPTQVKRFALNLQSDSGSVVRAMSANSVRIRRLRQAIKTSRPRCVLSMIAGTNVLTLLATRGLGFRVVISERNDPRRQRLGFPWEALRRSTYSWADLVTANSYHAIDALSEYVPRNKLKFIPNGIAIPASQPPTSQERERAFLAVGRVTRQKGFDVLFRAYAEVAEEFDDWRLVIVGDGEERSALCTLARELGIQRRIEWVGEVVDPFPYYQLSSIFVLPSRYEGVSNALLEAMAHGAASIATSAASSADEVIADGEDGIVVPADDQIALANAMRQLASNSCLRDKMAANARRKLALRSPPHIQKTWNEALLLSAPEHMAPNRRSSKNDYD